MSRTKVAEQTAKGVKVTISPEYKEKKDKSKGNNQNDRIEAKLDLIMQHLGITP